MTRDDASYFDLTPVDRGEEIRRMIVNDLELMGFEVEAAHHEVAPGQHEVDFKYADALTTADNIATFRFVVRERGEPARASSLPSCPSRSWARTGAACTPTSLSSAARTTPSSTRKTDHQLSAVALNYVEGLLQHARDSARSPIRSSTATRLVPGYEAPVNAARSMRNRSPLVRIPERRGWAFRCELRMPDPSANPYLSLAVQFAAGLDGVVQKLECREPVNRNIFRMSYRDRRKYQIDDLPRDLHEVAGSLREGRRDQGGPGRAPAPSGSLEAKREEVLRYNTQVTRWEVENYLGRY